MEENVEAINVLHGCDTQWKFSANGFRLGIDYVAMRTVMELRETPDKKTVFQQVKVMEAEVLKINIAKAERDD